MFASTTDLKSKNNKSKLNTLLPDPGFDKKIKRKAFPLTVDQWRQSQRPGKLD